MGTASPWLFPEVFDNVAHNYSTFFEFIVKGRENEEKDDQSNPKQFRNCPVFVSGENASITCA